MGAADPAVREFALRTGAHIYTPEHAAMHDYNVALEDGELGQYNCVSDYIQLKWNMWSDELNETILHELAHWSGAEHRLNRKVVRLSSYYKITSETDFHTEEATAQFTMYSLGASLGLNKKSLERSLRAFLPWVPLYRSRKAQTDADIAAGYLTDLVMNGGIE